MRRVKMPMFRYGEADWDRQYMQWGFHDEATQLIEAESVLRLVDTSKPLRFLDVACGLGTHAVYWAQQGHAVTAVDISQTFIAEGRRMAQERGASVDFLVGDVRDIGISDSIDVAVWIEKALYDELSVAAIFRSLTSGGVFIQDIRNPDHPRTRAVTGDWERWSEQDGVFRLERHTNTEDGIHHDVWIEIDTISDVISERTDESRASGQDEIFCILRSAGFAEVEVRTMDGEMFQGGEEPRWLWVVARKGREPGT